LRQTRSRKPQGRPDENHESALSYPFPGPPSLMRHVGPLPGGCSTKTLGTPKHHPLPGYHFHPPPACFGMDAQWRPGRIYHKTPRCKPTSPCRLLCCCVWSLLIPHQLSDVAAGLHFLHSLSVVHGNLKGVRDCPKPVL